MADPLRVKIKDFTGESSDSAQEWLSQFDLIVGHYIQHPNFQGPQGPPAGGAAGGAQAQQAVQNAQNAEIAFQFKVHLTKKAQQWLQTQAQAVQNNYQQLRQAFIGRYVNGDPQKMLESQLHNLRLVGSDVDGYVNSLLEIGRKLNRAPDTLTGTFLMGLQNELLKTHVMGTDNHTIENYRQRAKLYLSESQALPSSRM